jgi:hypothetical protein
MNCILITKTTPKCNSNEDLPLTTKGAEEQLSLPNAQEIIRVQTRAATLNTTPFSRDSLAKETRATLKMVKTGVSYSSLEL